MTWLLCSSRNTLRLSKVLSTLAFKLLALKPGEDEMVIYFAHPATLRTAKRTVSVTVRLMRHVAKDDGHGSLVGC